MKSQVALRSDGGGVVPSRETPSSARQGRPVPIGALRKIPIWGIEKNPNATVLEQVTPDGLGLALWEEKKIIGVITLEVAAGLVTEVRMMMNPYKLTHWN